MKKIIITKKESLGGNPQKSIEVSKPAPVRKNIHRVATTPSKKA
jgi:hypothetical protein